MFSPNAAPTPHTHSLRPKRARQTGSDDSIKLPRAKKQRSALRRDTFEPLTDANFSEVARGDGDDPSMNGHPREEKHATNGAPEHGRQLTLRGGKKADKRSERAHGALLLVRLCHVASRCRLTVPLQSSNDFYTVAQLPALPDQLRKHITGSRSLCRIFFSPSDDF
jgi:nuclear pore complex protein Nup133